MIRLKDVVVECDCCGKIGKPKIEARSNPTYMNVIVSFPDGWRAIESYECIEGVACPECVEKRNEIREKCLAELAAMIRKN